MSETSGHEQLQPEDTLDDRGVDDILDEGISPPEKLRGVTAHGVTPREEAEGETLEDRLAQEEPDDSLETIGDVEDDDLPSVDEPPDAWVGERRAGRLVAPDEGVREDASSDAVASDVGIDGAGASAEEAAMHIIDGDEL